MREKRFKNTDWVVLLISIALLEIGLLALYSATQNDELFEFKKQIQWALISVPFLILVYFIDYKFIVKFSPVLYMVFIVLLVRSFIYKTYTSELEAGISSENLLQYNHLSLRK